MKSKLLVFIGIVTMLIVTLSGCGNNEPEEIVYLEESEINSLFTRAEELKGKHVKISGQVFTAPEEKDGEKVLQLFHDVTNADKNFIVYSDSAEDIDTQDYVWVDGKIEGTITGENSLGGKVECPLIVDAKITKGSYLEMVTPTLAEITPAVSQEQNGISVTVDKVEYAKDETRVYVTINNGTDYNYSCGTYSAKLLVNGKQMDRNEMSQTLYNCPELSELPFEVMAGTSASGTLVFPAIEQNVPFQFILPDSFSDNYELMFTNYMIDVPVQ